MIRTNSELSVRRQCELLHITRSTVYYAPKEPSEEDVRKKEEIFGRIDYWHTVLPCMGTRKIVVKLRQEGYLIGRKQVRAYMREMGIYAIYPKPNLSKRDGREGILPYLLKNRSVSFPNEVWSIDITYIKMHRSHMYLTAIIDWFSRKIVGWTLSDTLDTKPVLEAVGIAMEQNGIPAILNSDQGSQFTSDSYRKYLKDHHIRQSMDGKSRWADNIMIERWFRSLKTELIYINEFRTPRELRREIGNYIRNYNALRPHEALDYRTPEEMFWTCFAQNPATNAADLDSAALVCSCTCGEGATESEECLPVPRGLAG